MIPSFFRKFGAQLRAELSFHFFVDVTTLLASIATVVALVILIHDRPEQANIAAWQLLQNYLQGEKRPGFDEGQNFALETLVKNKVPLTSLDAHDIYLRGTDLSGGYFHFASFAKAQLNGIELKDAYVVTANFEGATLRLCGCKHAYFNFANLSHAVIIGGDYTDADFTLADISDLELDYRPLQMPRTYEPKFPDDLFAKACFQVGHEPRLGGMNLPIAPQGELCVNYWGGKWSGKTDAHGKTP